jgi:hypothetical protein
LQTSIPTPLPQIVSTPSAITRMITIDRVENAGIRVLKSLRI